jgi:hypothetical protein
MEQNQNNLKKALTEMRQYEPDDNLWASLDEKLNEQRLHQALKQLPDHEPDAALWELISKKSPRPMQSAFMWWCAASVLFIAGMLGIWNSLGKNKPAVAYSEEKADPRLLIGSEQVTDVQYQKLKAYCETETIVCNSLNYRNLQQEYEKLSSAATQLEQAIGEFNTEPELIRQFNDVEQKKARVLNEMAKMI